MSCPEGSAMLRAFIRLRNARLASRARCGASAAPNVPGGSSRNPRVSRVSIQRAWLSGEDPDRRRPASAKS